MDILITESQTKILISEGVSDVLKGIYTETKDYSADLFKRVFQKLGLNLRILLTFSSIIGALARPLEDYLAGKFFSLNEDEILLLVIGVVAIIFNENRKMTVEILNRIKKAGLYEEFKDGLSQTKKLQSSFQRFLLSSLKTGAVITDIISYTYMIPLLGYLTMTLQGQDFSPQEITILTKRIISIGIFTISTEVLEGIVKKILGKS